MPERAIEVTVQIARADVPAGRLWAHRKGTSEAASFSYHTDYLMLNGAYELDPMLPLAEGQHHTNLNQTLFGAFSDCAPDGWGRRLIRREQQRSAIGGGPQRSFAETDYLLGVRDDLRQGALRFRLPHGDAFLADEDDGVPYLIGLPRLLGAAAALEREEDTDDDLRVLLRGGSSLGGARPKAHVLDANGHLAIAKFPAPERDEWDVIRWETVALKLAHAAGISVPEFALHTSDNRPVLILKRFDREGRRRIGYLSAMSMLERTDGEGGDYVEIAETIEDRSPTASTDLHELWRRIVFTILLSNTDDHLRNHGFLRLSSAGWTLAPVFDVNPNPDPGVKQFSTAIDGHTTGTLDTALELAELFRLSPGQADEVIAQVAAATGRWRAVARAEGLGTTACERMRFAFEHEQADCARERIAAARQG